MVVCTTTNDGVIHVNRYEYKANRVLRTTGAAEIKPVANAESKCNDKQVVPPKSKKRR